MSNVVQVSTLGFSLKVEQTHPLWPELEAPIHTAKQRVGDLSVPFREFKTEWFENEKVVFGAQGIPTWPALSPNYAAWKSMHFPGKGMMRLTDRLYSSLTADTPDTVYLYGPTYLTMGTNVEYSAGHQAGYDRTPARPHVVMLEQTFNRLNAAVFEYVNEPFARR